jgi:uncharacterized protein (TIGR02271 family)
MDQSSAAVVTGKDGLRGTVKASQLQGRGDAQVLIRLENGQEVLVPTPSLVPLADGSYYISLSLADLQGYMHERQAGETIVVPVIVEDLDVQMRRVETGSVRLTKTVHEREELIDVPIWQEKVEIKRVTVNRIVDGPPSVRHEGDTMIVPILEEVLVVEKRLMLTEELHISKQRIETHKPQHVTLRSEEVSVEHIDNHQHKEAH